MHTYFISFSFQIKNNFGLSAKTITLDTPIEYDSDISKVAQEIRKELSADVVAVIQWSELKGLSRPTP